MNIRPKSSNRQTGAMLLEALISILIFSIGILAIVGLQSISVKQSGDAKYRTDASLLANDLISSMWISNRTQATLQTNFQSPSGPDYQIWAAKVAAALPGVTGNAANQPVVAVSAVTATTTPSSQVTITIYWQAPSETAPHNYVTVAQII